MTTPDPNPPFVSEGLIEWLQCTAPQWATKLTMERLSFVRLIAQLGRERDELLAALEKLLDGGVDGGHDDAQCHRGLRSRAECLQCQRVDHARAALAKAKEEA